MLSHLCFSSRISIRSNFSCSASVARSDMVVIFLRPSKVEETGGCLINIYKVTMLHNYT